VLERETGCERLGSVISCLGYIQLQLHARKGKEERRRQACYFSL
jgi:hypothetical protein